MPLDWQVEATSARNGLGLVKLMGRQSGFIAMQAAMASGEVNSAAMDLHYAMPATGQLTPRPTCLGQGFPPNCWMTKPWCGPASPNVVAFSWGPGLQ